ncbi:Cof-type HAD-IIB family hydrolase [Niallia nealsonii]|uniref:Cof-type HAD-IIB family hydrolase n=1 Tax=Niallia nealsonii TaxID=115979 RepID=A0A2N0Z2N5_9BACI|nr:HAD family hydrolase [Niallia nealsonii]PKG23775.1 Cof-type HAD-IIB family hydrolase [Niallia nealsonii]
MTTYKILFLDIDGTILQPDDTIQESTKTAVKLMKNQEIEVFLATGRPLHEIADIGETLDVHSFIGYNGAYAVSKGEDVLKEPMSPELVKTYVEIAKQQKNELVLYTNTHNLLSNPDSPILMEFAKKFHLKQNKIFSEEEAANVLGITIVNVKSEDIPLYEKFANVHLSQVNIEGFRHSYDVISDKVNKGIAIAKVLDRLGINQKEAIAFGDGLNDKEMLSTVGEGFAMGNANEKLFAYAKHKTTSVTDSGIYNGLKSLGLIK